MPQITEGGMEYGVCFFDVGNNVAGRNRPSNAGTAAVYAAAVRCTGDHGVSSVVSDAHGLGGRHLLCAGGTCGTVLGDIPDSCGEGNGSVTIRFGKIAKPYFLTTLLKSNIGFGEFTEPVFSYKLLPFYEFSYQDRVRQPCQTRFHILTFRQFCRKVPACRRHWGLGLPQQARLSYKRYACANAAKGGVGVSKVPIILLMRKSAMKCGRWRMSCRSTSLIHGSGRAFAPWEER